jgi:hypothetical protein
MRISAGPKNRKAARMGRLSANFSVIPGRGG